MKYILYVEDEKDIGQWVTKELEKAGYHVHWRTSGEEALEETGAADLIILDVLLPGLDGFTLGQRIKQDFPKKPVIMLTARTTLEDKVHGLSFADDYLTKPFHPKELIARMEVLLRRFGHAEVETLKLAHLEVHPKARRIIDVEKNEEIMITGKQHQIFFYLIANLNQILTKEQIYEAIWNEPYLEGDKSLMVHIRHLREKIERDPSDPKIVQTVRGIGYRVKS
ncbi:MAG TPA: response regulator transcription factor [Bacillales bacterium]|nr:response regulator transcription factor [Bacillales bacterium]